MPRARAIPVLVGLASLVTAARADTPSRGGMVPVLSIAKSENKNQVQYVIRLDDGCAPVGAAPVSAYWRMLEDGPTKTAPILSREVRAYGLASQTISSRDKSGGTVRVVLNALPRRPMTVETSRGSDGACRALAVLPIAGTLSHLFNVYVHLKWDGVDYVLLRGWSMDGSRLVSERISE
jgi:hypothetical protein